MMHEAKLICYCFDYSKEDIFADVRAHGYSTIMERIMADKKAGACRCLETNPARR